MHTSRIISYQPNERNATTTMNKPIDKVCANEFLLIYFQNTPVLTRLGAEKSKIQTRSIVRQQQQKKSRQPNATLQEAKRIAKEKLASRKAVSETILCKDIYQSAMDSVKNVRGHTGIVYDNRMAEHRCLWDPNYPECPERFTRVIERYVCMNIPVLLRHLRRI